MTTRNWTGLLERIDRHRWKIPKSYKRGMRTSAIIYADEEMIDSICRDEAPEQIANVTWLPGIAGNAVAMPDIHWGYGFPIGGVAGFDAQKGVITPGGIGFDINCGIRLLRTDLFEQDVRPKAEILVTKLYSLVPCGVGSESEERLDKSEITEVMTMGAHWAVANGYGWAEDLDFCEENGRMSEADPGVVSDKAVKRGLSQLGTLGSGNHFVEVGVVDAVYDAHVARAFGLELGQVVAWIHSGSRGLGHQVCTDYLGIMDQSVKRYGIELPDRQLACAPLGEAEGKEYFSAMAAAANYAWANRQMLTHLVRQAFSAVFGKKPDRLGMKLVYDVAHNIAKVETHEVEGKKMRLCVHRKGATRAFPKNHPDVPPAYRDAGQPVLVPGDMGRYSYVLVASEKAMLETFGSACHGAGRVMSREMAKKGLKGARVKQELEDRGIVVRSPSNASLAEEASQAYKDVSRVVDVMHGAGIATKVARTKPVAVIKG